MDLINGEPLCAEYLPLRVGVDNSRRRRRETEEEEESDSMVRRRADLGFKGRVRSVLVDCTTASPLAKEVKDYKPGKAADAATKRKVKDYQRFYDIQQTNRCSIFFFAVETTGGLGKEARDYVKLLAKLAGGTLSATGYTRHWQLSFNAQGRIRFTLQIENMLLVLLPYLYLIQYHP
jgi:hypothetical protein